MLDDGIRKTEKHHLVVWLRQWQSQTAGKNE